jgi:hypothetical protein
VSTLAVLCLGASAACASAYSEHSVGTPEQVAWVRRAAGNFLTAELAGNGAGACAILAAPLRASVDHRTCAQRWDARLRELLRRRGERTRLRSELRARASARVVVHGSIATIELAEPLLDGANRFLWTENCWMLKR